MEYIDVDATHYFELHMAETATRKDKFDRFWVAGKVDLFSSLHIRCNERCQILEKMSGQNEIRSYWKHDSWIGIRF